MHLAGEGPNVPHTRVEILRGTDEILEGRSNQALLLEQPLPANWVERRDHLGWWTGEGNRPSTGSKRCIAAIPHRRRCARLRCPLPRLSTCWPKGCGYPREWGVSGVVKSLVNVDLLSRTSCCYVDSGRISSVIQRSIRKTSTGLQARSDHSAHHLR
jgi:hypothetical protein